MFELLGTASKHSSEWLPDQTLLQLRVDTCFESSGQISQVQASADQKGVLSDHRKEADESKDPCSQDQQKEGKVILLYWQVRTDFTYVLYSFVILLNFLQD